MIFLTIDLFVIDFDKLNELVVQKLIDLRNYLFCYLLFDSGEEEQALILKIVR